MTCDKMRTNSPFRSRRRPSAHGKSRGSCCNWARPRERDSTGMIRGTELPTGPRRRPTSPTRVRPPGSKADIAGCRVPGNMGELRFLTSSTQQHPISVGRPSRSIADPPCCSGFHALMNPVFILLDNRRFSFADMCKLRDDYPALCAGEPPCPKLRKRNPRSQKPIRLMRGIRRLRLGRKNASSRLCRERHTTARLESWALSRPF